MSNTLRETGARRRDPSRSAGRAILLVFLAVTALGLAWDARDLPPGPAAQAAALPYDVREVMIPMRDGTRLHTTVYSPKDADGPLPIIFNRTPYGISGAARRLQGAYKELAADGYIFAFQDIRGRYKSEGSFVMIRPVRDRSNPRSFDEASDAFDTIDWLVKNVPGTNGRVGMLGVSYDGWLTAMAILEPHPALRAVSPQAPPADMWLGDDFFHNGAFRLSYGFEYATRMETSKEQVPFEFDRYDTFDWYLALGPLSNVNATYLKGRIPTWNDFVDHPSYDEFWKRQTLVPYLDEAPVPVLNVAGWWDQEDFYGPLRIYDALERHDEKGINFLVAGPWNHGGWNRTEGDSLGVVEFGSPTSRYYRGKIQAPWFAHFLKDEGERPAVEAWTFETGTNAWRSWDAWPPKSRTTDRNLYFGAEGRLDFERPAETATPAFDSYVSDPDHPVPYRHRPVEATYFSAGSGWSTWLLQDQRFVDDRPDVLSWETEPLADDVTIAGTIEARLFASTTGSDSDWIVKLIDVYPEKMPGAWTMAGYELMVANEVFRGRYRKSFERPEPVPPNEIVAYTIDLHSQNYCFKKGHRIMVQVQSTWFPLIDRNPQSFVPNIFEAVEKDFQTAVQRVHRSASHPSHLVLPVVKK
jgi:putative CocE/NonD family hydrolase